MPWALFTRDFRYDRPNSPICFEVAQSPEPQLRPRDVVAAAVKAGAAEEVDSPRAASKARAGRKKQG